MTPSLTLRSKPPIRTKARIGLIFTFTMLLVGGGTALAEPTTVSASAGPVTLPDVPVEACVDEDCGSTPALSGVVLTVEATAETAGVAPASLRARVTPDPASRST